VLILGSCWRLIGSWTVDPVPGDQMALLILGSWVLILGSCGWRLIGSWTVDPLKWLLNCSFRATPVARAYRWTSRIDTAMSERGAFALSGYRGGDIGAPP
jgi:hypothetical protein